MKLNCAAALILCGLLCMAIGCSSDFDEGETQASVDQIADRATSTGSAIEVVSMESDRLVLSLRSDRLRMGKVEVEGRIFDAVTYGPGGAIGETGHPLIPFALERFAIPVDAEVRIRVEMGKIRTYDNVLLMPVQPPAPDLVGAEEPLFTLVEAAYLEDRFLPEQQAWLDGEKILRGVRFDQVMMTNLRYNPKARQLQVCDEITITVEFVGGADHFERDPALRCDSFEGIYQSVFLNYKMIEPFDVLGSLKSSKSANGAEYLIITHPDYLASANLLRDWKVYSGIDTVVKTTTDTGTTAAAIRSYVQNAYDTWSPPPQWVLLIGDAEKLPTNYESLHPYTSGYGTECYVGTDLYYSTVDGTDNHADIGFGRIPCDTTAEASDRIAKIIAYERNPPADAGFYTRTTHAAYFQHAGEGFAERRFARTTEEAYQYFANYNTALGYTAQRIYTTGSTVSPLYWNQNYWYNFSLSWWTGDLGLSTYNIPAELQKPGFAWDGGDADVKAAVNAGTFMLTHRDHGFYAGWGDPYYDSIDVSELTNGSLVPVVFSLNCETGWFDNETDGVSCDRPNNAWIFTEEWMDNLNGGAVGIVAATRVSYSGCNDYFFWGMMDAIYPSYVPNYGSKSAANPNFRMADVVNYGKFYMESVYNSSVTPLTFEIFHWFGDPTMKIWTQVPQNLNVSPGGGIPVGSTSVTVNVVEDGALVTLVQDGEILGRGISSGGAAVVTCSSPLTMNNVHVTVTKHNYRPYETDLPLTNSTCIDLSALCTDVYLQIYPQSSIWRGLGDSCTYGLFPAYAAVSHGGWMIYLDYENQGFSPDCAVGDYAIIRGQDGVAAYMEWTSCVESGPTDLTVGSCS
jgi:peptidase C25-like protein